MDLSARDSGSTLLIGPTLSGRRQLFYRLLAEPAGRPAVVATRDTTECLRSRYHQLTDGDSPTPIVIDCITDSIGRSEDDTGKTKYAQGPGNLTSIGTKFTEILGQHETDQLSVGLTNLSPLLVYSSPSDVFQFVHIIIQRSIGAGWPVFVTIDPSAHDASTVKQFVPLFDDVIEVQRTDDGNRKFRVQKPGSTDWYPV